MDFVQHGFNLADEACEEALLDSTALHRFVVGIDLGRERVPDGTTLLKFRRLLERHDLGQQLFATVGQVLQARGLKVGTGTIVDATIISAPSSTKNSSGERDPQMHQTRKGQQGSFGMKAHIGVDVDSGLVHSVVGTAANVHDLTPVARLLHGAETHVHADAGLYRHRVQGGPAGHRRRLAGGHAPRPAPATRSAHRGGPSPQCLRTPQGAHAGPGRTSLPGHQAAVRLSQGPLSRPSQEHRPDHHPVRPVEPVDDATKPAGCCRGAAPGMRGSVHEMARSRRFPVDTAARIARSGRFLAVCAATRPCHPVRPFCSEVL